MPYALRPLAQMCKPFQAPTRDALVPLAPTCKTSLAPLCNDLVPPAQTCKSILKPVHDTLVPLVPICKAPCPPPAKYKNPPPALMHEALVPLALLHEVPSTCAPMCNPHSPQALHTRAPALS